MIANSLSLVQLLASCLIKRHVRQNVGKIVYGSKKWRGRPSYLVLNLGRYVSNMTNHATALVRASRSKVTMKEWIQLTEVSKSNGLGRRSRLNCGHLNKKAPLFQTPDQMLCPAPTITSAAKEYHYRLAILSSEANRRCISASASGPRHRRYNCGSRIIRSTDPPSSTARA